MKISMKFGGTMETKKQKIKRLKEIYIQIEQFMKGKNKQKKRSIS